MLYSVSCLLYSALLRGQNHDERTMGWKGQTLSAEARSVQRIRSDGALLFQMQAGGSGSKATSSRLARGGQIRVPLRSLREHGRGQVGQDRAVFWSVKKLRIQNTEVSIQNEEE
jgi:hypothetical protein